MAQTPHPTAAFPPQRRIVDGAATGINGIIADAGRKAPDMLARFSVRAVASAQSLPRILEYFAQRDLTPSLVSSRTVDESLLVAIEQPDLDAVEASIIAEKMRAAVLICSVELLHTKS